MSRGLYLKRKGSLLKFTKISHFFFEKLKGGKGDTMPDLVVIDKDGH